MSAYPGMKQKFTLAQSALALVHLILAALFVLPILITLSISLSSPKELMYHNAGLLPSGFSWEAYVTLMGDPNLPRYYLNTIFYASAGTLIMLLCTMLLAFTLTKKTFAGRKTINVLLLITMFFNGGLVPTYLLINNLGLYDTVWAIMLPGAVSAYNVFVVKTFIKELPDALIDAAAIDGASHFRTLFQIVIPLSKPVIATLALFSIVGYWNEYFSAVMYLRREELHPIAMLLRKMVVLQDSTSIRGMGMRVGMSNVNPRTVKSAAVIVTMLPVMMVYPFMQKYFAKGLMIGSVKE